MNRLSAALATVTVLALVGCGGSGKTAGPVSPPRATQNTTTQASVAPQAKYGSVGELHDAAVAAGYACPSWTQDNAVTLAAESGTCSDADVFTTYASPGQLEQAITQTKENNATLAGASVTADPSLVGENWMILGPDVQELQPGMGGTILR